MAFKNAKDLPWFKTNVADDRAALAFSWLLSLFIFGAVVAALVLSGMTPWVKWLCVALWCAIYQTGLHSAQQKDDDG